MKYYRRGNFDEANGKGSELIDGCSGSEPDSWMIPVEVDEWHTASERPKPWDFDPTGSIEVYGGNGLVSHIRKSEQFRAFTHWRKITPPNPRRAS